MLSMPHQFIHEFENQPTWLVSGAKLIESEKQVRALKSHTQVFSVGQTLSTAFHKLKTESYLVVFVLLFVQKPYMA